MLKIPHLHGIFLHGDTLFLADVNSVYSCSLSAAADVGEPKKIIHDLPDGGQHPNRTIAVGPDGGLYITVGSTCNACKEPNPEAATILKTALDGTGRGVFAMGLRNTIGFGWHPRTGAMWGMDHGIDDMGDDKPGEELNELVQGRNYGWPFVSNDTFNDTIELPKGKTKEEFLAKNTNPVLTYTAHAAPLGMVFCGVSAAGKGAHAFPAEYRDDALIAFRGSWNRAPASGYEIVRLRFRDGKPTVFEPFVTGFLTDEGKAQFGRPAGIAFAADGALLFTDDTNGVMYRVWHEGGK